MLPPSSERTVTATRAIIMIKIIRGAEVDGPNSAKLS
jgi:hypothetical protein